MRIPIYFFLLFIIISIKVAGQCPETNPNCNQVKNWVFGDSVWLHFSDLGVISRKININTREASSLISKNNSDSILYYGTPEIIFNEFGSVFCDTIKGHQSSTQGSLFLKVPNDTIIHYFTSDEFSANYKISLYHHMIIKDQIYANIRILNSATEQLASINHQNNRSIWLFAHLAKSDTFYIYPITNNGLLCPNVLKNGGDYSKGKGTPYTNGVQIKISPQSKYVFAYRSEDDFSGRYRVDLFEFNQENGILNSNIELKFYVPFHSSFSPDGNKLYLTNSKIYQYDLSKFDATSIQNSELLISTIANNSKGEMNIGPDGKIYLAYSDSSKLGIINFPNEKGLTCDFRTDGLKINYGKSRYGLPNFNASYFYTPSIDFAYTEDCWEHKYSFEGRDTIKASSWKWFFRKNNFIDSILTKHCDYQFLDTGLWQVSHIAANSSRTDTVTKTLTIYSKWQKDILGNDTFYCQGIKPKFVLKSPPNMHCIHWNGEEPNLDEDRGPIIDYNHFHMDSLVIDTAGIYYVKITNKTFCENWDTIKIEEKAKPIKPNISFNTGELASTLVAKEYNWYLNDTFLFKTTQRSFKPNKNGYYQLKIVSEFGCESDKSDSLWIDLTSIKQYSLLSFELFPNPSNGHLQISLFKTDKYFIEVIDHKGNIVISLKTDEKQTSLDLTSISKGNYIIRISDSSGNNGSKMIFLN